MFYAFDELDFVAIINVSLTLPGGDPSFYF